MFGGRRVRSRNQKRNRSQRRNRSRNQNRQQQRRNRSQRRSRSRSQNRQQQRRTRRNRRRQSRGGANPLVNTRCRGKGYLNPLGNINGELKCCGTDTEAYWVNSTQCGYGYSLKTPIVEKKLGTATMEDLQNLQLPVVNPREVIPSPTPQAEL